MTSMTYTDPTAATPPLFWMFTQPEDNFWVSLNKMRKDSKRAWIGTGAVSIAVLSKWGLTKAVGYFTCFILPLILETLATDFSSNHGYMMGVALVSLLGGWLGWSYLWVLAIPFGLVVYHWTTDLDIVLPAGVVMNPTSVVRRTDKGKLVVSSIAIPFRSLLLTINLLVLTQKRFRRKFIWWVSLVVVTGLVLLLGKNYFERGILDPPFPWD